MSLVTGEKKGRVTHLDGPPGCSRRKRRSHSSSRIRRRRKSHTCCLPAETGWPSSVFVSSARTKLSLALSSGVGREAHEVKPLLLDLVHDDFEDLVRDRHLTITLAVCIHAVQPDLVCRTSSSSAEAIKWSKASTYLARPCRTRLDVPAPLPLVLFPKCAFSDQIFVPPVLSASARGRQQFESSSAGVRSHHSRSR